MAILTDHSSPLSPATRLQNPRSYQFLIAISMAYISVMLSSTIVTNRYIGNNHFFVLGGTFISPFIFILDNIIAETYGYRIAVGVIITGFLTQTIFALVCQVILAAPSPAFFKDQAMYVHVLGPTFLHIISSAFIAYMIANILNSYIVSHWKILLKGRKFWLRSIGASIFSEGLYSLLAILMMELQTFSVQRLLKLILASYLIKVIYTLLLAAPASLLVRYMKQSIGIDVYDFHKQLTPLKYSSQDEIANV